MILGWREFFQTRLFGRRHEFVSADARRFSNDPRMYEMLDSTKSTPALNISSPDRVLSPGQAHPLRSSPMTPELDMKQDYFGRKHSGRVATSATPMSPVPTSQYISPTSPNIFVPREWDPRATQARPYYAPGTAISKDYS